MTTRFLRWWLRTRFAYLNYRHSVTAPQKPNLQYLLDLTRLLNSVDFSRYDASQGIPRTLDLLYPDIGAYTQRLSAINDLMATDQVVDGHWLQSQGVVTNLDGWLTVVNGKYVNPAQGLRAFLAALERMLGFAVQHQSIKVGVPAANRRVMRDFYVDLENLTRNLILMAAV